MQQTHEPDGRLVRGRLALASLAIATTVVTAGSTHHTPADQAGVLAPVMLPGFDASMVTLPELPTTTIAPAPTTTSTSTSTTVAETTTTEPPPTTVADEPTTSPPAPPTTARRVVRTTTATAPATTVQTAPATVATEPPTTQVPLTEAPPVTESPASSEPLCWSTYGSPAPEWMAAAITAAGWPAEQISNVCHVAGCESNFHPWSVARAGRSTEVDGLMQIMRRSLPWSGILQANGWTGDQLLDPVINLTVARIGWEQMGSRWTTSQWSCATSKVLSGR